MNEEGISEEFAEDGFLDDPYEEVEVEGQESGDAEAGDDMYIDVVQLDEADLEEADGSWTAMMPYDDGVALDWDRAFPVSGTYPNTTTLRNAQLAVPKKMKDDPMLSMSEADGNVLRLCISTIDGTEVKWRDLRGNGLDKLLTFRQVQLLSTYFNRMTSPTRDEVDAFLSTVKRGYRPKRRR